MERVLTDEMALCRVTLTFSTPTYRVVPPFTPNVNTNTHFNRNLNTFGNNRGGIGARRPINNNVNSNNIPFTHRWFISGFTNCTKKCGGGKIQVLKNYPRNLRVEI